MSGMTECVRVNVGLLRMVGVCEQRASFHLTLYCVWVPRLTIKLDRLIVLSKSSLLGWFLHVSLIKPFSPLLSQPFQVCP